MTRTAALVVLLLALMACSPTTPQTADFTPLPTLPPLPTIDYKPTITPMTCPACPICVPTPTPTPASTPPPTGEIIVRAWWDESGCDSEWDGVVYPATVDVLFIYRGELEWPRRVWSLYTGVKGIAVEPYAASGRYTVQVISMYDNAWGKANDLYLCEGTQSIVVEIGRITLVAVRFGRWK